MKGHRKGWACCWLSYSPSDSETKRIASPRAALADYHRPFSEEQKQTKVTAKTARIKDPANGSCLIEQLSTGLFCSHPPGWEGPSVTTGHWHQGPLSANAFVKMPKKPCRQNWRVRKQGQGQCGVGPWSFLSRGEMKKKKPSSFNINTIFKTLSRSYQFNWQNKLNADISPLAVMPPGSSMSPKV